MNRKEKTERADTSQNIESVVNVGFVESAINGITDNHIALISEMPSIVSKILPKGDSLQMLGAGRLEILELFHNLVKDYHEKRYTNISKNAVKAASFVLLYTDKELDGQIVILGLPLGGFVSGIVIDLVYAIFKNEYEEYQKWKDKQKRNR
uniref:Uncharacterized protein n=1 Tax=Fervidobacterium pennivorans TaxID=93466 RepID=A0A7V4KBQ3_FERPE